MRLGISSPLMHTSAEDWAKRQTELGCRSVVFPVQSNEPKEKIAEYKEAADKYGLLIAEVGIWRNALAKDPEERRRNRDYCVAQLRLADELGARCDDSMMQYDLQPFKIYNAGDYEHENLVLIVNEECSLYDYMLFHIVRNLKRIECD